MEKYSNRPRQADLDIVSIRFVLRIAEYRSLRRAARALDMSESSLSHRLRGLEEVLGVSLFQRSSEGVVPTDAGLLFFIQAREALRVLDSAAAAAAASGRGALGRLTLGLYTSLSSGDLRNALVEFAHQHPSIEIQIIEGSRSEMIEGLRSGSIDLTVMIGAIDPYAGEALGLWQEPAYVILPINHRLARETQISWDQLTAETFLFSTKDAGPEAVSALDSRLAGTGRPLNRRLHMMSRETLYTLVAIGTGVSLMIQSELGHCPADVVSIPLYEAGGPTLERLVAYRDPGNDNPALRRFWSLLKRRCARPDPLA